MECEKSLFSKTGCTGESLATGMSCEFQLLVTKLGQTLLFVLQCSDPAVLTHHLPACFTRVLHFGESLLTSQSRVQSQVTFLLHTLDQIFALSHTQPLHYSHLNTGFLNAELQANLTQNKVNTQLNKFNFTNNLFFNFFIDFILSQHKLYLFPLTNDLCSHLRRSLLVVPQNDLVNRLLLNTQSMIKVGIHNTMVHEVRKKQQNLTTSLKTLSP